MKKQTAKIVSMLLAIIMLMSLVTIPAFASLPSFRDPAAFQIKPGTTSSKQHRYWIAPYGDEVSHFDYYATDGDNEVEYYFFPNEAPSMAFDSDGILTMTSQITDTTMSHADRVLVSSDNRVTAQHSGNINIYADSPFIFNFDDPFCYSSGSKTVYAGAGEDTTHIIKNASVVTDETTGNKYIVSAHPTHNLISVPNHWLRPSDYPNEGAMNSFLITADVLLKSDEDFVFHIRYGAINTSGTDFRKKNYLTWNHSTKMITDYNGNTYGPVEPGWHNVKMMLVGNLKTADNPNPYRNTEQMYTLFFDDDLITPTRSLDYGFQTWISTSRPNNLIEFQGTGGLDNFKLYGSSTPHAYNVGLSGTPKSGNTVEGTASMAAVSDYTNSDTHFIYNYYISDTTDQNGTYSLVTSDTQAPLYVNDDNKLVINSDLSGRYIKVGARVWNRGGMSPEVMSKSAYKIEGFGEDYVAPYVVYDASKQTGDNIVTFKGKTAYKWGPGDAELRKGISAKFTAPTHKYRYIVVEMYSAIQNYHPFNFLFYGVDNPNTSNSDYYKAGFHNYWQGEWKTIKIPISGGYNDMGNCTFVRQPIKKPYETNHISLSASLNTSSNFYPETEVYVSKIYFDGVGPDETELNEKGEYILPNEYNPGTMTDYVSILKENYPNKTHPRILVDADKISRLKEGIVTNEFMKTTYGEIKKRADAYLLTEPEPAQYMKNNAIAYSRKVESIAKNCGMVYLLTDESILDEDGKPLRNKYAERIWKEAEVMFDSSTFTIDTSDFWYDTSTGLDAGHIANGMALLYDWCYDYLTDAQKTTIRNAVMKQAMVFAMRIRNGSGFMGFRNNVVAANAKGFMSPILAFCDEEGYEDLSNEYINNVIDYLPLYLEHQFKPDGNYAEGINYWRYTVMSLMYMSDAMKKTIGTDGGITDMEGLEKTSYFTLALRGSKAMFNYSDSGKNIHQNLSPVFQYLAERYNVPALRAYRLATIATDTNDPYSMEDLVWYNPDLPDDTDWGSSLPKDYFMRGLVPITSMRSGYGSTEVYVAAKGGNSKVGHCQYDAGTFVFDANDIRWIHDLGSEAYGKLLSSDHYYRIRSEGQNCIVFNPSESVGQTAAQNEYDTLCPITDSGASEKEAYTVFDLKPSYQEYVDSYSRGVALVNDRSQVVVQDKFSAKEPSEIYSFFHVLKGRISTTTGLLDTDKNGTRIIVNSDGRSLTLLSRPGNQECRVDFITDIEDFELGYMDAVGLPTSPSVDSAVTGVDYDGNTNIEFQKFYLHAKNVKDATITVVFTPIAKGKTVGLPEIKSLDEWSDYLGNATYAKYNDIVIESIEGNTVIATTNHSLTGNKNVILAAYKDNALVAVKNATFSIDSYKNNVYTTTGVSRYLKKYTIEGFDPGDYDTIKAFIWDDMTSSLKPITSFLENKK